MLISINLQHVFGSGKWKLMWQTQNIICFYSTLLEMNAEGQNRAKNKKWRPFSDMIYQDFTIPFFFFFKSPYVCDLNAVWWLLKHVTWLQGPVPWVKGQDCQAEEFLKAFQHVKSFQHDVCYYNVWISSSVCTFVLFPYICVLMFLSVCVYVHNYSQSHELWEGHIRGGGWGDGTGLETGACVCFCV